MGVMMEKRGGRGGEAVIAWSTVVLVELLVAQAAVGREDLPRDLPRGGLDDALVHLGQLAELLELGLELGDAVADASQLALPADQQVAQAQQLHAVGGLEQLDVVALLRQLDVALLQLLVEVL